MKSTESITKGTLLVLIGLTSVFIANPPPAQGDTWETKAPLPVQPITGTAPRAFAAGGVIDTDLYVAGGHDGANHGGLAAYDSASDSWAVKNPIPIPVTHAAAGVIDRKLYVASGCVIACSSITNQLQIYDPAGDSWTFGAPIPIGRAAATGMTIGEKLYVVGGSFGSGQTATNLLHVYDPSTNTWQTKAPMPTPRENARAAAIDGKLYVVGGSTTSVTNVLEVYDPNTDSWESKAPMPTARNGVAVGVINGLLHVAGGATDCCIISTHEVYDPSTDTWDNRAPIPTPRHSSVTGVINSMLFVAGGQLATGSITDELKVYIPQTTPLIVAIDIKPGVEPNSINPRGRAVIPVAILTTDTFDATMVDPTTVLFGATGTEAPPLHAALEDVDVDGDIELLLHFKTQDTGVVCGETSASLTGETFGGQTIEGSDSINTVGCN